MRKKIYKVWSVKLSDTLTVIRRDDGWLVFLKNTGGVYGVLGPAAARRLSQKLSGDYRD